MRVFSQRLTPSQPPYRRPQQKGLLRPALGHKRLLKKFLHYDDFTSCMGSNKDSIQEPPLLRERTKLLASRGQPEEIIRLIQQGEEPKRIFMAVTETALLITQARGAALYLPQEEGSSIPTLSFTEGDFVPEDKLGITPEHSQRLATKCGSHTILVNRYGTETYYSCPIITVGTSIGHLTLLSDDELTPDHLEQILLLAHHTGMIYERQTLTGTVQHFLDRLQVLNQLNSLIASNAGVAAMVKSIARESAFRFGADVSLALTLTEEKNALEILRGGAYGCAPNSIPVSFPLLSGILTQVVQLGGHMSIPSLVNYHNHGLAFLQDLGIASIDAHCLEVRGDPLGVLVLGFRREQNITRQELNAFQEFCQGAAVAVANARTQERITAYTERLQELVESRTHELERQTQIAEEANHSKSQFLANMSHELRTPLTAIIGYSSVLKDGIFGPMNEKQRDALVAITRSSEHLKNLIDDVLNLARVESGKENPEAKVIPLKDILHQSYKLMMQSAISKGVTLEQPKLPDEIKDVAIHADPKHLQQILINLMSNAVKYTPRGGKVWLSTAIVVDKIRISVHDTGVGIPPAKQRTLFERFERGDDTYSKNQEGTGIGLNLTKHLVELNGGRIGAESVQGQGSTFWIMMPLAEDSVASCVLQDSEQGNLTIDLKGLSTLVVDDNRDTCDVLKMILIHAGASVTVANSVREGISVIEHGVPDIILTDLAMPQESGLVLIHHVRTARGDLSGLPIIVLSACAFASDRDAALEAGASTFIPKPFHPADVLKTVRELTFSRALQR